ncbi:hypothetical protein B0J11DRAFT_526963 [Dendryphion nanum]|uniref:Uncharacterized protein n=1 Tax=Dendryphion nanum TaxID=256645 RepID=A0A9P9DXV9_9PLEO|nr:hypothetical protein B0J11DRAFT_526963 [Dendryphion nanum]
MSAFPKGLFGLFSHQSLRLPSSVRVAIFSTRPQFVHPPCSIRWHSPSPIRFFGTTVGRLQASKPPVAPIRSYVIGDPVLRKVHETRVPILLYKAQNRHLFTAGVYVFAFTLVGASLFMLRWGNDLPRDLPFFVGPTYVVVAFIMFGIAAYIFSSPVSRCRAIEVIPGVGGGPMQFRITTRKYPIFKDQVIVTNIGEPLLAQKIFPVARELQEAERARKQSLSEDLQDMSIIPRMWEIAARFIEQKWTSFFLRFKFAVLRFGIVKMEVYDTKWKIDCTGYLLEDGKAIDRLVAVD